MVSLHLIRTVYRLLVLVALLAVAACQNSAPTSPSPTATLPPVTSTASPGRTTPASSAGTTTNTPQAAATLAARGERTIILATTTSVQDSGLLDALLPLFQQQTGYQVKVIAVGTGQALALGARGEADVLLVHSPDAERQFMEQGNGRERLLVATNDFVIVGPPDDPAGIEGMTSALEALKRIAATGATWVSRDDRSGTDLLEKKLWQQAGIDPRGQPWYITTGQGMGMTLVLTDQKRGYTLSDRSTYLAYRQRIALQILVEGDPLLLNQYHVITVNPEKFPQVNTAGAEAFARFLVSPQAQQVIATFGVDRFGQPLFRPASELPTLTPTP